MLQLKSVYMYIVLPPCSRIAAIHQSGKADYVVEVFILSLRCKLLNTMVMLLTGQYGRTRISGKQINLLFRLPYADKGEVSHKQVKQTARY